MGQTAAKPSRTAPARFVAKKLPRDPKAVESEFRKTSFTIQGINEARENMYSEPRMYVETKQDDETHDASKQADHIAPRWVLNSYMEMIDNAREDNVIISGNLPASWERDKHEPYALVRNRIDEEDLHYVLSDPAKALPMSELVGHTKLERETLQDILDTVELPRTQYRNYKGKLHKSIEDANAFLAARKEQQEKQRERDILSEIGFTKDELKKEEQYITNRSRGVKTLDMLGASINEKKRREKVDKLNDMEELLEQRKMEQIAEGTYTPTEKDMEKPHPRDMQYTWGYKMNSKAMKSTYALDFGQDPQNLSKYNQWMDRRRLVKRAKETIHGVPQYSEKMQTTSDEMTKILNDAAEANMSLSRATGSKGFIDPRNQYDSMLDLMRTRKSDEDGDRSVNVVDKDQEAQNNPIEAMPHIAHRREKMRQDVDDILAKQKEEGAKPAPPGAFAGAPGAAGHAIPNHMRSEKERDLARDRAAKAQRRRVISEDQGMQAAINRADQFSQESGQQAHMRGVEHARFERAKRRGYGEELPPADGEDGDKK